MSLLELSVDQVIELVKQMSIEDQYAILSALNAQLQPVDEETLEWLEADFGEDLPPYEWGLEGIPQGKPVRYISGRGLVVEGSKEIAE